MTVSGRMTRYPIGEVHIPSGEPGGGNLWINANGKGSSWLTVYAGSTLIYSGSNFITNFKSISAQVVRRTYQTGPLKINGQTNIHGTLKVEPVANPLVSFGTAQVTVSVDYAQGYLDTGDVTTFIDSDSNAVFFATDKVSSGYRVT